MKRIFLFFPKQRQKDVAITNAGKKKAKENLNSSGPTNKVGFPTKEELGYQSSA